MAACLHGCEDLLLAGKPNYTRKYIKIAVRQGQFVEPAR